MPRLDISGGVGCAEVGCIPRVQLDMRVSTVIIILLIMYFYEVVKLTERHYIF